MKPVKLRPLAEEDLVPIAAYCAQEGGLALAERMFDAAMAALKPLHSMPARGSLRLGQLCQIPGLRSWRVTGFPLQWFYFETDQYLDVIRLLGDRQDIASLLNPDG